VPEDPPPGASNVPSLLKVSRSDSVIEQSGLGMRVHVLPGVIPELETGFGVVLTVTERGLECAEPLPMTHTSNLYVTLFLPVFAGSPTVVDADEVQAAP
jgi:hypothetical protein